MGPCEPSRVQISVKEFESMGMIDLTDDNDPKTHLDKVICLEINDKFLVSGSTDCSAIIWRLPGFKPMKRLIMAERGCHSYLNLVALFNDYIVYGDDYYIEVWKSSLDNSDQLQFNLQYRLEAGFCNLCIHNGILYTTSLKGSMKSWNIEAGHIIQKFPFDDICCIAVNDQNIY